MFIHQRNAFFHLSLCVEYMYVCIRHKRKGVYGDTFIHRMWCEKVQNEWKALISRCTHVRRRIHERMNLDSLNIIVSGTFPFIVSSLFFFFFLKRGIDATQLLLQRNAFACFKWNNSVFFSFCEILRILDWVDWGCYMRNSKLFDIFFTRFQFFLPC